VNRTTSRSSNGVGLRNKALGILVGATGILGLGSSALAEVYSTPGNEVAVGTNGSSANAQYVGVGHGGGGSSGKLVAANVGGHSHSNVLSVSTTTASGSEDRTLPYCPEGIYCHPPIAVALGNATGIIAVSGAGYAYGDWIAVSGGSAGGRTWGCGQQYGLLCMLPSVVVAGTGSAYGDYAISLLGPATSDTLAVSGMGTASGNGGIYGSWGTAVSGTGYATGGTAVSGTNNARGHNHWFDDGTAVSGTGTATAQWIAVGGGGASAGNPWAEGVAVAGDGDANSNWVAVSGTRHANANGGILAVSGTGPASTGSGGLIAVSGTGNAYANGGLLAVSGTGDAYGATIANISG
jgi:hypothetical protein